MLKKNIKNFDGNYMKKNVKFYKKWLPNKFKIKNGKINFNKINVPFFFIRKIRKKFLWFRSSDIAKNIKFKLKMRKKKKYKLNYLWKFKYFLNIYFYWFFILFEKFFFLLYKLNVKIWFNFLYLILDIKMIFYYLNNTLNLFKYTYFNNFNNYFKFINKKPSYLNNNALFYVKTVSSNSDFLFFNFFKLNLICDFFFYFRSRKIKYFKIRMPKLQYEFQKKKSRRLSKYFYI